MNLRRLLRRMLCGKRQIGHAWPVDRLDAERAEFIVPAGEFDGCVVLQRRQVETEIVEAFEAESENPVEVQRQGWQSILDHFKQYAVYRHTKR